MKKPPLYGVENIPIELSPCIPVDLIQAFLDAENTTLQEAYSFLSHCNNLDNIQPLFACDVSRLEKIVKDVETCFEIDKTHKDYWKSA